VLGGKERDVCVAAEQNASTIRGIVPLIVSRRTFLLKVAIGGSCHLSVDSVLHALQGYQSECSCWWAALQVSQATLANGRLVNHTACASSQSCLHIWPAAFGPPFAE